jgi:hypothetical protein
MSEGETGLDWRKLPVALHYVIEAAEKYGDWRGDPEFYDPADAMTEAELSTLSDLADHMRVQGDAARLTKWTLDFPIDKHPESSLVYHLGLLLDYLDLPYE